jgi:predicted O-methyltransferase YrrM
MSTKTIALTDTLARYLLDATVTEPTILRALREETQRLPDANLQIAPEQGQLMRLLVELVAARRCLEVGVYTGYSALSVALSLPADGLLVACDVDPVTSAIATRYWDAAGVRHKVQLELAPAAQTLARLLAKGEQDSFDFAFIDADKDAYDVYYELCLSLVRPGGLIALDNMLWCGRVSDPLVNDRDTTAIRALNSKVGRDTRVSCSLVPIGDGLMLARKH